ncbi:hypothetical protein, partial [Zavarzinella formosa]|uniref:hypothetical protein n=1 Tax=Zavarzinella formosa TaxID=360055 RepID=UPI0005939685
AAERPGGAARRGPDVLVSQFQNLSRITVEQSVALAVALAQSGLDNYAEKIRQSQLSLHAEAAPPRLTLQSLVLSGRASALPEVIAQFRDKLQGPTLGISPDRILFRSEYAKSATAIGAWRGMHRYLTGKERVGRPAELNGKCEMDIEVQNLFFFLPTSYRLGTGENRMGDWIFTRHSEFRQHGPKPLGLIRSKGFVTPGREEQIYRDDGDNNGVMVGRFVMRELANLKLRGDLRDRTPADEVPAWQVRYEITHQRRLSALVLRASRPPADPGLLPIYDIRDNDEHHYTVMTVEPGTLGRLQSAQGQQCPFDIISAAEG